MAPEIEGWGEYRRLILRELEKLDASIGAINSKLDTMRVEISTLKVKSGLWGAAAGALPGVVLLIFWVLSR